MSEQMESPCKNCSRVRNPDACENKNCRVWRQWFQQRWDETRKHPALQRQLKKTGLESVNIGGRRYAHPDRVREYLATNPCDSCPFPRELCNSPCPAMRAWMETRKEVLL